jgi:hypothetical protein
MHGNPKRFPGFSLKSYVDYITTLVNKHEPDNLLDYGCGKGYQYLVKRCHEPWGILPHCYDPAVTFLDTKPEGTFGGVICTDVLEHVPEDDVDFVLSELFKYAEKFVFLSIATFPARKTMPNGINCHVTVKDKRWWLDKILQVSGDIDCVVCFHLVDNQFELVTSI